MATLRDRNQVTDTSGDEKGRQRAIDDAFVASFRVCMLIAAGFALLSALCAALTIGAGPRTT